MELIEENHRSKPLWASPWKFKESLLLVLGIITLGIIMGVLTGGGSVNPVKAPYNIYIVFAFFSLLVFLFVNYREKAFVNWLTSVPSAICSIGLLAVLVLLMGIVPQNQSETSKFVRLVGLDHVKTSWIFQLAQVYFLASLGMVTIKRCIPFKGKNIGFFLNHFGLLLTLTAALLGSGDISRLTINLLEEGEESNIGISEQGDIYNLPFTVRLIDFTIDEYNPKLAIVDPGTGKIKGTKGQKLPAVEQGVKTNMGKWHVEVLDYLPQALFKDSAFVSASEKGSYPAAKVIITQKAAKDIIVGWLGSGSYLQEPGYIMLDSDNALILTLPEPRKFSSLLILTSDSTKKDTIYLEVNKPFTIKGWKLYQMGYDQSKGKSSSLSVLEAVSDPWLPVVYFGIFLVIIGAVYLFWIGSKIEDV